MSIQLMERRPPHVRFEERSEEDRNASIEAGRLVLKSVHFVLISQPGSKDCVEKDAEGWLADIQRRAMAGAYPQEWVDAFRTRYEAWKRGLEAPPMGFPVREWAAISRAQADNLCAIGVLTVEDLANANEPTMARIGMGARTLKDKAQAWLDSAKQHGNAEELAALRAKLADLSADNERLHEKLQALAASDSAEKPARRRA